MAMQEKPLEEGWALRRLRMAAGLESKEFAARAGVSPTKLSKIELGRQGMTLADMRAFVRALRQLPEYEAISSADLFQALNGEVELTIRFVPRNGKGPSPDEGEGPEEPSSTQMS